MSPVPFAAHQTVLPQCAGVWKSVGTEEIAVSRQCFSTAEFDVVELATLPPLQRHNMVPSSA